VGVLLKHLPTYSSSQRPDSDPPAGGQNDAILLMINDFHTPNSHAMTV